MSLCTFAPILTVLNEVSEHLQKVKIDLLEAHNLISALKTALYYKWRRGGDVSGLLMVFVMMSIITFYSL